MDEIVTFFRMVPWAVPPMQADVSALGTLPVPAFQNCEAVRTASAVGWYVFPAKDATLYFDGKETKIIEGEVVRTLDKELVGREFDEVWISSLPPDLHGEQIAWLTAFHLPGLVQVWSGHFIATAPGWSIYVKPIANYFGVSSYSVYEGVIETDVFSPCPLFVNLRLHATDQVIQISSKEPLFQVLAIPNATISPRPGMAYVEVFSPEGGPSPFDWQGYLRTTRSRMGTGRKVIGQYGSEVRRRRRHD